MSLVIKAASPTVAPSTLRSDLEPKLAPALKPVLPPVLKPVLPPVLKPEIHERLRPELQTAVRPKLGFFVKTYLQAFTKAAVGLGINSGLSSPGQWSQQFPNRPAGSAYSLTPSTSNAERAVAASPKPFMPKAPGVPFNVPNVSRRDAQGIPTSTPAEIAAKNTAMYQPGGMSSFWGGTGSASAATNSGPPHALPSTAQKPPSPVSPGGVSAANTAAISAASQGSGIKPQPAFATEATPTVGTSSTAAPASASSPVDPAMLARFRSAHGGNFNPGSRMDRWKMQQLTQGNAIVGNQDYRRAQPLQAGLS